MLSQTGSSQTPWFHPSSPLAPELFLSDVATTSDSEVRATISLAKTLLFTRAAHGRDVTTSTTVTRKRMMSVSQSVVMVA